jgi:hypothetical protein
MYQLSDRAPLLHTDISWDGKFQHYPAGAKVAAAVA